VLHTSGAVRSIRGWPQVHSTSCLAPDSIRLISLHLCFIEARPLLPAAVLAQLCCWKQHNATWVPVHPQVLRSARQHRTPTPGACRAACRRAVACNAWLHCWHPVSRVAITIPASLPHCCLHTRISHVLHREGGLHRQYPAKKSLQRIHAAALQGGCDRGQGQWRRRRRALPQHGCVLMHLPAVRLSDPRLCPCSTPPPGCTHAVRLTCSPIAAHVG
jgi:hypothetical protein